LTIGRFDCLEPKVTRFVGQPGGLNRQRASQAAGFAAVVIAVAVLIGWGAELPLLTRWGSGYSAGPFAVPMLAAFGLALVYPGKDSRFAFAVGFAGIAYAAVGLVVALFNIERWLAPQAPSAASFRVTSAGMLAFGLAAGALALSRFERYRLAVLASIAGGITAFALLGYLSGVDTLYGSASVNSPSLPAAVGLLCVTVGIILRIGTMPVFRKPRPLWHLLVMLGCAIIGPLLLYGAYAGFRFTDAQLRDVRENLAIEARTLSANIDQEIAGEIDRLQGLAAWSKRQHRAHRSRHAAARQYRGALRQTFAKGRCSRSYGEGPCNKSAASQRRVHGACHPTAFGHRHRACADQG
jgi:hypothetical protein